MSTLGKILLYVALVGAIAAAVVGFLVIQKNNETATNLAQAQQAKANADQATKKAQAEAETAKTAQEASDTKLTAANASIDDLKKQLDTVTKQASDAATAMQTANENAKVAQDALDKIKSALGDETPDQYKADKDKAQSDLAAALAEQKILQDQVQSLQGQVADAQDQINRAKTGTQPPGISGKVTFVDRTWNFVVLNVGLSNGVVPNGELIVYRGRNFLGKVRVTKADPNDSVAEILPDIKGNIQIGDAVLN